MLWTLDTETRCLFGEIFRIGLYSKATGIILANDIEFIYDILSCYEDNHIYIHNLDFDLSKFFERIKEHTSFNFDKSIFIDNSPAVVVTDVGVFHDSLKLLPSSLDNICKSFGLGDEGKFDLSDYIRKNGYKDKEDFFMRVDPYDKVLNYYLEKDCTSLHTIIETLIDMADMNEETFFRCPTTPSLAMQVFKTQFTEDFKKATKWNAIKAGVKGKNIEDFIRMSYYGGRTEVFKPLLKNGYHYDVNSLYPYVMLENKFPVGFPESVTDFERSKNLYMISKNFGIGCGFLKCRVHVPKMEIPVLPYKDGSGKLLFPIGKLEGVWSYPELQLAEKMGCKIEEFFESVYFKDSDYIFKNYVSKFKHLKETSKGALRDFAKRMLNTLYGKFGMRRERATLTTKESVTKKHTLYNKYTNTRYDVTFYEYDTISKADYIQTHIASYVTAYARITLYKGFLSAINKGGNVYYCDTDSIATDVELDDSIVDNNEFGKYKLETYVDDAIFLQPKFYAETGHDENEKEVNTTKGKGIPRSIMNLYTFKTYQEFLKDFCDKNKLSISVFENLANRQKFLSSLKHNDDLDKIVLLRKTISLTIRQKRKIDYIANTTTAWEVKNYGDDSCMNIELLKLIELSDKLNRLEVVESLESNILLYGKIDIKDLKHIKEMKEKNRKRYTQRNGISLEEFCSLSGWDAKDIFEEVTYD